MGGGDAHPLHPPPRSAPGTSAGALAEYCIFCKITQNFTIFSLGKYLFLTRDLDYKYCNFFCIIV